MASLLVRLGSLSALALLCASCSQSDQREIAGAPSERSQDASSPPDISLTAAPGVSFNYEYRFRIPDQRISETQEAHAAACEKLGLAKCRITGMSYSLDGDENVSAQLSLKLDPAIARAFGKAAASLVERNDGRLDSLEIGSNDEGAKVGAAHRSQASIADRIARIDAELAKAKPAERAQLVQQLDLLRAEASRQADVIGDSQEALATTPLRFSYYGEGGAPGFRGNPLREAWSVFVSTVVMLAGFLLRALAVLIPLGIVISLLVLLWRSRPVRWFRRWLWENGVAEPGNTGVEAGQS